MADESAKELEEKSTKAAGDDSTSRFELEKAEAQTANESNEEGKMVKNSGTEQDAEKKAPAGKETRVR